jgi:outer membrane protein
MRKFTAFLIVLGLAFSFSTAAFAKELKIAYVDVFKVFDEYSKTKEYDKNLEGKKNAEEKKLEAKRQEVEAIQKKIDVLKDKEQDKEKEKLAAAVKDYRQMEQESFASLKKERDEKMKEIIDDIDKIIKDYAAKNGYDFILNENTILYGEKSLSLTADILKIVNEKGSAPAAAAVTKTK